jgi:phage terminase small subunit
MGVLSNGKREKFAQALAKGENATRAYALAGFKPHRQAASRMLTNVDVQQRVHELREKVAEKFVITQAEILEELKKVGFSRINRAVKWGGRRVQLVDSDRLDDDTMAAVAEVRKSADGSLKIKLHDKMSALELAAKIQGFFDHDDVKRATQIIVISRAEREGRL